MNSKDIGILTYDYSINYGAVLQAFALCEKLKSLKYVPHIIRWAEHYYKTAGVENDNLKYFRNKYLPRTKVCYTSEELDKILNSFSKIIIGGDQVFRNWANLQEMPILRYFGDFVHGKLTLASYGASFGTETFNGDKNLIEQVKFLLKRFDKIGVREKSGVRLLNNLFDVKGTEVLDPVFLLSKNRYLELGNKAKKISNDYIGYMYLADEFGLGDVSDILKKNLSQENIININKNSTGEYNTVEQWLCNIINSKFIITDSFHCIAFAIIFQKPFIVVDRDFGGNSRIDNILEKLNLTKCRRQSLKDIKLNDLNLDINWDDVNSILHTEIKRSELFLEDLLNLIPKYKEKIINEDLNNIRKNYEKIYKKNMNIFKSLNRILPKILSVKNEYKNGKKRKVLNIFGVKLKIGVNRGAKMQNKKSFTTIHYLISMLKAYGIKEIVASPGIQNACFNLITQKDNFFRIHSVVDERSAGYVASGISSEISKPVVITCTGATASRNYLSALTEAYYRKLPLIAITFFNYTNNPYNLGAQFVDRSVSQNDIKELSIELPVLNTEKDKEKLMVILNTALSTAIYKNVPVHINCPSPFTFEEIAQNMDLPDDIWITKIYDENNLSDVKEELKNKDVAIFIGSHNNFTKDEENAISNFATALDIPVLCDHTSGYYGKNKVLISQVAYMLELDRKPDIVIDIGEVTGEYSTPLFINKADIWRISKFDGLKCRYNLPVKKIFNCSEKEFFTVLNLENQKQYYSYLRPIVENIKIPDLPLSMPFVCQELSKNIPQNSTLHLAILNSLRSMNYFNLPKEISTTANVGGFGIDGALSTTVGHAIAEPNKTHFCLIGDLAFFYDMNILGNKHIANNLKILLVNNNRGEEFRLNWLLEKSFGDQTDEIVAAAGHYKNGARLWAESCDFNYLCATDKSEFTAQIDDFCNKNYDRPVLFEIFTTDEDEKNAQWLMMSHNRKQK